MKFEISKEWCMKMAELENGQEIGAGAPTIVDTAQPTMRLRWWRGTLQQAWMVTRHLDARLEKHEATIRTEWREVPSDDQ